MPPTPAPDQHGQFLIVLGALSNLVVLSIMIERGLAFLFEHEWFKVFGTQEIDDPANPGSKRTVSRAPAWKGSITLGISIGICFIYQFDAVAKLFAKPAPETLGIILTGFVAAGGSAGAIAVFQGYLNFNKESRDAVIAAKKADADAAKLTAELNVKNVQTEKTQADASKANAEANIAEAEARKKTAEVETAKAEVEKKKLPNE